MSSKYDDIIHLPHHVSPKRPRMSAMERAAQFSPFAALTGFEAKINETARLTDRRVELDEYAKAVLNEKLQLLLERLEERPEIRITYFKADARKEGGSYKTIPAILKKVDSYYGVLVLEDGTRVPIEDIYDMEW